MHMQHHIRSVAWEGLKLGLLMWVLSTTLFPAQYCLPVQMDPVLMKHDGKYSGMIMGTKTGTYYFFFFFWYSFNVTVKGLNKTRLFSIL